jgi:hypothetical protein
MQTCQLAETNRLPFRTKAERDTYIVTASSLGSPAPTTCWMCAAIRDTQVQHARGFAAMQHFVSDPPKACCGSATAVVRQRLTGAPPILRLRPIEVAFAPNRVTSRLVCGLCRPSVNAKGRAK